VGTHPSDLALRRLAESLLDESEAAPVKSHLEKCKSCQSRLDQLTDDADIAGWRRLWLGNLLAPPPCVPGADQGRRSARRARIVLTVGAVSAFAGDFTVLLRKRFSLVSLIGVLAFGLFLVKNLLDGTYTEDGESHFLDVAFHLVALVMPLVALVILRSSWRLSLRSLRLLETSVLASSAAFFAYFQWWGLRMTETLPAGLVLDRDFTEVMSDSRVFRWFALIVTYGAFVPTTPRRCLAVTSAIALCPVLVTMVVGVVDGALGRFAYILGEMVLWLGIAVALAVYGSYKIAQLQDQAVRAGKFRQYQLIERLGSGGMGEVWLAQHRLLPQRCAIKVIRPERAGDPKTLRRFRREVQAMAKLTHENTVRVFNYGRTQGGQFYYAMEYLPGLSLQQLVDRYGPLPPERTVHLLTQVCSALCEAHGLGLVHRDIKPSNILVCERGGVHDTAKVLDFGLVQEIRRRGRGAGVVIAGTPAYMSPEQALGNGSFDSRGDLYSLGAVGYFALTGRPPFERADDLLVCRAQIEDRPTPLAEQRSDIPADVADVIMCCLEKAPMDRYTDARSLKRALSQCRCASHWSEERAEEWWRDHPL
jgi:serine/threonine-protein kinase